MNKSTQAPRLSAFPLITHSRRSKRSHGLSPITTLLSIIWFAIALSACGIKYSSRPQPRPVTPADQSPAVVQEGRSEVPTEQTSVSPAIQPSARPLAGTPRSLPAAIALRQQAGQASQAGNYSRAIGLLERAIRISPNDPATFFALAENHLAEHRPQQALELTSRALTLNPTPDQQLALEALQQRCLALL